MPNWFQEILEKFTPEQKAELCSWILQEPDDNKLTTEIITVLDPGSL